ncbi:hypothetical protein UY416_09690 [Paenibacillus polymyxa]|uniref:hypothetical protein n=1 Tax=Paenibacillus polymyxa TaxID=1406 RepID=UPI002AB5C7D0|nr:hypothetical protein [Paenibacillus polymyxa]MDY8046565.1 hypothetical protein [Paenibacillus polymyxa]
MIILFVARISIAPGRSRSERILTYSLPASKPPQHLLATCATAPPLRSDPQLASTLIQYGRVLQWSDEQGHPGFNPMSLL